MGTRGSRQIPDSATWREHGQHSARHHERLRRVCLCQRHARRGSPEDARPRGRVDPICGDDNRLKGVITDRDIVVNCVADGRDPSTVKVSEMATGETVTIGADDSVEEVLRTMSDHGVRRLPVIDGHELIGVVSQADVAKNLPEDKVGDLVAAISASPSND